MTSLGSYFYISLGIIGPNSNSYSNVLPSISISDYLKRSIEDSKSRDIYWEEKVLMGSPSSSLSNSRELGYLCHQHATPKLL
jgi:hypothetical protein